MSMIELQSHNNNFDETIFKANLYYNIIYSIQTVTLNIHHV
jgi:hypothetical protein